MAEVTGIEWADHTFAPWFGCTRVSSACDLCYAEHWTVRCRRVDHGHMSGSGNRREPTRVGSAGQGIARYPCGACLRQRRADVQAEPIKVDLTGIDWIICGGETDPMKKPRARYPLGPDFAMPRRRLDAPDQAAAERREDAHEPGV